MRKTFYILTMFLITLFTLSCKKELVNAPQIQTITANIKMNQAYEFDLGNFGDEEGATITKQAGYFTTSLVYRESNTGKITYKYTPANNFVGVDEVKIKSVRGSSGASVGDKIINTTIKITVTN